MKKKIKRENGFDIKIENTVENVKQEVKIKKESDEEGENNCKERDEADESNCKESNSDVTE